MDASYSTFPQKQIFFSKKGWTAGFIIWGTIALLAAAVILPALSSAPGNILVVVLIILGLIFIFLIWVWFGTYYTLTPYYLRYTSGPIRGKISITSIEWVKHQHILRSGLRIALANNGLLIRYNKYDEIYVSPADKAGFIYALQQLNPNIKVKLENES